MIVQNLCWLFRRDLLDCACYPTRRPPGSQSPKEKSTLSTFRIGFQHRQKHSGVTNSRTCVQYSSTQRTVVQKWSLKSKINITSFLSLMTNSDNRWVDSVGKKCSVTIALLYIHCYSLHWNVDCSAPCTLYTVQWYVYSVHIPVLNITLLLLTHPNGVPILLNIYVNSDHLCWIFAIWVFHLQSILYSVAVTSVDSSMHRNDACCVPVSSSAFAWAANICVESSPFRVFTSSQFFKVHHLEIWNILLNHYFRVTTNSNNVKTAWT